MSMDTGKHTFMVHAGGHVTTEDFIRTIPLPEVEEGGRYGIVPHGAVLDLIESRLDREFPGHAVTWKLAASHEGRRVFGLAVLRDHGSKPWGPGFAFRNSYDKSMKFAYAAGASIFICDNTSLRGDAINYSRPHIGNAWPEIEMNIISGIVKMEDAYGQLSKDLEAMEKRDLSQRSQWAFFGEAVGRKLLTPRQYPQVIEMVREKATESRYGAPTVFRAMNEITQVQKDAPVHTQMALLAATHSLALEYV
jgi:hypothetical protein